MENHDSLNERINEIRRKISLIEWDIPNLKNENIKIKKEGTLKEYKEELNKLVCL